MDCKSVDKIKNNSNRIDRLEKADEKFEERITKLELDNARVLEKIDSLIKRLDTIISVAKALTVSITTGLFAFFVWYIQGL